MYRTLLAVIIRAFHWVALPRFPGGPAGLYLKPMLAVLNKCVHIRPRGLILTLVNMEVPTNPTRQSAFVWIYGSFFISANEIRVSREDFFCSGTADSRRHDPPFSETGSWKLEVGSWI